VQTDDALSPCGELDFDEVCNHVYSKPDKLEMHSKMAYDHPFLPTHSIKKLGKV
jgi:hypothetical protein